MIECELGKIVTVGHKLVLDGKTIYNSTEAFFERTGSREAFKSDLFRGMMLQISTITSYRNGAELLNRMRRTDNGLIETHTAVL